MRTRIRKKIFKAWQHSPKTAYKRYGIGRVLTVTAGIGLYNYPDNGYYYFQSFYCGRVTKYIDKQ